MTPGKYNGMKYARDWVGKRVRLTCEIKTGNATYPAGLTGRITGQGCRGLDFLGDKCACCSITPRITSLGYSDVELLGGNGVQKP